MTIENWMPQLASVVASVTAMEVMRMTWVWRPDEPRTFPKMESGMGNFWTGAISPLAQWNC